MSIVLILFPMYRGNLFDFLQFDNAVFLSAFRCKGCFHICCPIQINIPIKCSIRCRCYQIYKLIDNIVADSATTKINKAVQSGTDTLYIQSFRIAFFLWNFIKCFLKFLDFFIDRTSHCLIRHKHLHQAQSLSELCFPLPDICRSGVHSSGKRRRQVLSFRQAAYRLYPVSHRH